MKKNCTILFFIFFITTEIFTITFKWKSAPSFHFQINLDTGVGFEGTASTHSGIKDFNSVFIRPSFFFRNFGIGFDLKFRFRNYPEMFQFHKSDFSFTDDVYKTICRITDMIDFIRYGTFNSPIYFTTGKLPYLTVGNGLLISQFHNNFFAPSDKQNGLYFHLHLSDLSFTETTGFSLPLSVLFFMSDLLDPDIFLFGISADFAPYLPLESLSLDAGLYFGFDFDAAECNILSTDKLEDAKNYRNLKWDKTVKTISIPSSVSYTFDRYAALHFSQEIGFIIKDNGDFDAAASFQLKGSFLYLENSGFLITLPFGIICQTDCFHPGYFAFNYENVRRTQYFDSSSTKNYLFQYGLNLTGFKGGLLFSLLLTSPFQMEYFTAIYEGYFLFNGEKNNLFPELDIGIRYRTTMSQLDINGNGGNFIESLTKKFRFSVEVGYRLYGAKLNIVAGMQTPNWVEHIGIGDLGYADLQNGIRTTDMMKYGSFLVKFMKVEVAIAL